MHSKSFLWIAIIWTGIVTYFCMVDGNKIPRFPKYFDKLGHMGFHFGITFLWFLYFKQKESNELPIKRALQKAFLFSFFYGILIEICQGTFTKNRTADVFDVMANATGAALAVITVLAVGKMRSKP